MSYRAYRPCPFITFLKFKSGLATNVFVCLCLCIFLLVFVCIYVLPVTSPLSVFVSYLFWLCFSFVCICLVSFLAMSVFVSYLFWLCFSKTVRVNHCFYPLKNPCKREESLMDILTLEIQTSFSCYLKS